MKKILLLCQQKGTLLELSPARYQLIHELNERKYELYVYFGGTIKDKKIRSEIAHIINTSKLSMNEIRNGIVSVQPDYVIASTYEDTQILYSIAWRMKKTTFIYFNLEIYTPQYEMRFHGKGVFFKTRYMSAYILNKTKEMLYNKQCDLLVIQDSIRKKVSRKYFIHNNNTILIPNSYIKDAEYMNARECSGMVYSGGLYIGILESLLKDTDSVPDVPITFQGWPDMWFKTQYKKLKATHPDIKLYDKMLRPEELTGFLQPFAIGLIWYNKTGNENVDTIGLSSGKFFKHMSLGQPVITNNCLGLASVVKKYELGKVVNDVSELKDAYEQIMERYSFYRQNVIRTFENKYEFTKVIQPFLEYLER